MKSYRTTMALVSVLLFFIELTIAMHIPSSNPIRSFGGGFLVVILLYAIVQTIHPAPVIPTAVAIAIFSCGVECIQIFHPAEQFGFAPGSLVQIIMGSTFSWIDMAMYLIGIGTIVNIDSIIRTKTAIFK